MKRLSLALLLGVAACSTTPKAPPKIVAPPPAPIVVPPRPSRPLDWQDLPYTPGTWTYAAATATYGLSGATPLLVMQCDSVRHVVTLSRSGVAPSLTIRTSYDTRTWPASAGLDRSIVALAANDPALDQIAFSRGRFSIAAPGLPELDIPAWAAPARVIEDCRG